MRTFLSLILVSFAADADAADIVLRERVAPSGPVVRLGEIASVVDATPDVIDALEALPMMPAPAPGDRARSPGSGDP